jgi:hypothetical protein
MEFLDGRHFTDPAMPGVSAKERKELYVTIAIINAPETTYSPT